MSEAEEAVNNNVEMAFLPGDVIQDYFEPFIKVLNDKEKATHCSNCFKQSSKLLRCSCCKIVCYCDKNCQKKDWKFAHSIECKLNLFRTPIQRIGEIMIDKDTTSTTGYFSIIRILAHLKLHPNRASEGHKLYNGIVKCFNDLGSYEDENPGLELLSNFMAAGFFQVNEEWDAKFIQKLFGVWKSHAFTIMDDNKSGVIGGGIFIQASFFNHSCRPTALRVINGFKMQIRCIGPIPLGSQPVISYLAGNRMRGERQKVLKNRYKLDCKCDLCEQESEGPATDYKLLNTYKAKIENIMIMTENKVLMMQELETKMIVLYKLLFHQFDERITNLTTANFNRVCTFYVQKSRGFSMGFLDVMAQDTLKRIEITFGKENNEYKKLKAYVQMIGIRV